MATDLSPRDLVTAALSRQRAAELDAIDVIAEYFAAPFERRSSKNNLGLSLRHHVRFVLNRLRDARRAYNYEWGKLCRSVRFALLDERIAA
jgi:hypothetical protein